MMRYSWRAAWVLVLSCLVTNVVAARETGVVDLVAQARVEVAVPGGLGPLAPAGDVNGDGRVDYVMGAPQGFRPEAEDPGRTGARVVLGEKSFRILGGPAADGSAAGRTLAAAGDVNGDGLGDVVITDSAGASEGAAFVVYGSREPTDVDLSRLGGRGFVLGGVGDGAAAGAGDVNGDGLDDLVVSSDEYDVDGSAFVVFSARAAPRERRLDELGQGGGFAIRARPGDLFLGATAAAGEVNGDGLADVIVGAPISLGRPPPDDAEEPLGGGAAYVVLANATRAP